MNDEIIKELDELKSPLARMDKQFFANVNEVPANYFEGMEDRFFQRLRDHEVPREAKQISLFSTKRISYAIAAVSAFVFFGLGILNVVRSNSGNELSQSEVESFLEEEGDFLAIGNSVKVEPTKKLEKLSDDEIKNYLCEVEGMDCGLIN